MAFQQRPQPIHQRRSSDRPELHRSSLQEYEPREDPQQEWVLFSPAVPSTVEVLTASINEAPEAAAASRLSAVDSGFSLADHEEQENQNAGKEEGGVSGRADDELDSLDSHLHAFRDVVPRFPSHHDYNYMALLPTHNGLGSFLATPGQERASTQHHELEAQQGLGLTVNGNSASEEDEVEKARTARIQAWRLEQSILLQEALQGSVGQKKRKTDARSQNVHGKNLSSTNEQDSSRSLANNERCVAKGENENIDSKLEEVKDKDIAESLLDRLTRRVLKDVLRIDEPLLSIIFGEELVEDSRARALSAVPDYGAPPEVNYDVVVTHQTGWLDRLLERLARELGLLVHHLTEHPGAFSTYPRRLQATSYLERSVSGLYPSLRGTGNVPPLSRPPSSGTQPTNAPQFRPSIPIHSTTDIPHHAYLDDITSISSSARHHAEILDLEDEQLKTERAYWERELGVTVVFSFLRDRFRRRRHAPPMFPAAAAAASSSSHDPLSIRSPLHTHQTTSAVRARAAALRHHHPLIPPQSRRNEKSLHLHLTPSSSSNNRYHTSSATQLPPHQPILLKRPGSSCGSQSTKSKRTKAESDGNNNNNPRHEAGNFWDFDASHSFGSVSLALPTTPTISTTATTGPLGYWGEV